MCDDLMDMYVWVHATHLFLLPLVMNISVTEKYYYELVNILYFNNV